MKDSIGFIGMGSMGLPMALNLIKAGFQVTVYNRTHNKAEPAIKAGAKSAKCPRDLLSDHAIIITVLSNDQAVEEVVFGKGGLGEGLQKGHIHLSMSTISPDTSKKLHQFHQDKGADYLVATISGRPEGAAAQKLWIFLAGVQRAKERVASILQTLGQKTFDIGEDPIAANIVKLCGNFLIISAIEAISEASMFAEKQGLDRTIIDKVFAHSLFACPIYQIYAPIIAEHKFEPAGFKLSLGLKDVNLLLDAAKKCEQPLPLANLVHHRLLSAIAKGRGEMDWSAIALGSSEET